MAKPIGLTLAVIALCVGLFYARIPFLDAMELTSYDLRFRSRGAEKPSRDVVMALIDERSLDAEGRWPWPRSTIARLVDALSRDGASVIAFDVGFLEPQQSAQLTLIDEISDEVERLELPRDGIEAFLAERRRLVDDDTLLAEAIARSRARVVLGYFFHDPGEKGGGGDGHGLSEAEIDARYDRIIDSAYPLIQYAKPLESDFWQEAYAPETNLPILSEAAASSGYFTLKPDGDGVVRRMPLAIGFALEAFPPLSVLSAWEHLGRPRMVLRVGERGVEGLEIGDRWIPTDEEGRILINFRGDAMTFPNFSVADILAGTVPAGSFRDRIVLVGATATGTYDMRSTPFNAVYPGVEIQANAIDNLLAGDAIAKPAWTAVYDVLAIVFLGALAALGLSRVGALAGLGIMLALSGLHVAVARELFVRWGVWLDVVHPLIACGATYTMLTLFYYVTEERERKKIRGAFGKYVSSDVIEQMMEDPSRLELGGEERVATVLFSDLQGFTSYSEHYGPRKMMELLSEYYGCMTERVFDHGGMLKEYVGDELMAIFGAPVEQADHAVRACRTALAMQRARRSMNAEWLASGRPELYARTGVNSGPMLVGNLGSEHRFAYGALGDDVNLGSRLEGLNKQFASEILIGENTRELVSDLFVLREIDQVRVVGKRLPTRIFELLGEASEGLDAVGEKALRAYAAGLEAYRARCWGEARELFDGCRSHWPDDGPSAVMAARCAEYEASPPDEEWEGVYEAKKK